MLIINIAILYKKYYYISNETNDSKFNLYIIVFIQGGYIL